jgi:hypothetical protein
VQQTKNNYLLSKVLKVLQAVVAQEVLVLVALVVPVVQEQQLVLVLQQALELVLLLQPVLQLLLLELLLLKQTLLTQQLLLMLTDTKLTDMLLHKLKRRVVPILLFLLPLSCSKNSEQQWSEQYSKSSNPPFSSSRLFYPPNNELNGLELELRTQSKNSSDSVSPDLQNLFVNVFSRSIPPHFGDPTKALLTYQIENKKSNIIAERFAGGQKLLLPPRSTEEILDALKAGLTVTIKLEGFEERIPPTTKI